MNINDIRPNPDNPRTIKDAAFKKLVQSIRDFPEMLSIRPIVINKSGMVLGGNMRLEACREAGLIDVPVKQVNLSEEQEQEFIIKDNLGYGEWDFDKLHADWDVELLNDWGLDLPASKEEHEADAGKLYEQKYEVVAECDSEREQQRVYDLLNEAGYKCRVLTI